MKKMQFSARDIAYTAIMSALVFVATVFISIRTGESYTNLGDSIIFLTAAFFGPTKALIAGGIGSFFADFYSYPMTMWFTLIIKSIEGLIAGLFVNFANKIFGKDEKSSYVKRYIMYIVGMIVAVLFMVFSYYICKAFIYGTKETALISLPKNFIQGGLSIIVAIVLYGILFPSLKRFILKDKLEKSKKENMANSK